MCRTCFTIRARSSSIISKRATAISGQPAGAANREWGLSLSGCTATLSSKGSHDACVKHWSANRFGPYHRRRQLPAAG